MTSDPWFDQWEPRVNEALHRLLPFSDVAVQIYLQALAATLAGADHTEQQPGLAHTLLEELGLRLGQLEQRYSARTHDLRGLHEGFVRSVVTYQHRTLHTAGQPLPECTFDPPCPYH